MQDPSKHYTATQYDAPVWADWMRPNRTNNSSWDSELAASLSNASNESSDVIEGSTPDTAIPVEYTWTPPTPTLDSDHSSSQLSIESPSLSELDELPEIPFISTSVLESDNTEQDPTVYDFDAVVGNTVDERTFWANVIRPNLSRSSASGRPIAVLGQTNQRVLSAGREKSRSRSPSVSSTASSRSKPPPAKSILSSGSSIRTCRGRKSPSVKFLDAPTIHYESDEDDDDNYPEYHTSGSSYISANNKSSSGSGLFDFFRRIVGSAPPLSSKKSRTPERPVISAPIPIWDAPRRRARHSLDESSSGKSGRTPSLRSNRSTTSLKSVRSCSSRLQTYWGRVTGKDP